MSRSPLPPLLSERPPALRVLFLVVLPLLGGFVTGAMLGVGAGAWAVANVIACIGGFLAGFDHDTSASAARRGAFGGLLFGLALVLADALVVDDRAAKIADPAILQVLVTTLAGTILAVVGVSVRGKVARRHAAAAAAQR
ncbi:hypothetical protein DSM104299_05651 [Baekduia alba]|uniref:hypothetical protein n=1 Tax=Baekduia alba TaxID=2997333 RepID=UPI0023406D35|nr:hypothetical protein [Baekduia alba]WCB96883.1 hypothetical protein DSM104299_05651 [Baekduia alba]